MTDYDQLYREDAQVCGDPFQEYVAFFEAAEGKLDVLDLGCGQGRDALMAARKGHRVMGVDIARSGVEQLLDQARAEGLDVEAEVADMETFAPRQAYDVIILDRVLHMLASDDRRLSLLDKVRGWVRPAGHVLVADTRRNRDLIRGSFPEGQWSRVLARKDFFFVQRVPAPGGKE